MPKYIVLTKQNITQTLDYEFEHDNPNLSDQEIMDFIYNEEIEGTLVPDDHSIVDHETVVSVKKEA